MRPLSATEYTACHEALETLGLLFEGRKMPQERRSAFLACFDDMTEVETPLLLRALCEARWSPRMPYPCDIASLIIHLKEAA